MKKLIVGGDWTANGGRQSEIVKTLAACLKWPALNGGDLVDLRKLVPTIKDIDVLLWMPNISNDEAKLLPDIKKVNPHLLLIQSKRVIEKSYTESDIIGRLLASHANLGIMITKPDLGSLHFKLLDPLGNVWADTGNAETLADRIASRVETLLGMERVNSVKVGDRRPFQIDPEFIRIIRDYGARFTQYVNAVNPNRLLGNASTRCAKGFPSMRVGNSIFVTRRNVDKATLSEEDFVEVETATDFCRYYGDNKPSVDTPIQLRLFDFYPNVNYMLHGHVYAEGGIYTRSKIPCGFIDEYEEIKGLVPDFMATNFIINLRGHGCLILAKDLDFFSQQKLIGRPFPEGECVS